MQFFISIKLFYKHIKTIIPCSLMLLCALVMLLNPIVLHSQTSLSPAFLECGENHEHKYCSHIHRFALIDNYNKAQHYATHSLNERGYDVMRYDLFLDWFNPLQSATETDSSRYYSGIQEITIRTLRALEVVVLDAEQTHLHIDSVYVGEAKAPTTQMEHFLAIPLQSLQQQPFPANDTLRLRVYFRHISSANASDGLGFFLYNQGRLGTVRRNNDSVFLPARLAYTMSQPFGARRWMPCNDTPADKALITLRVRVPAGFTAVSNGLLQKHVTDTNGGDTFLFSHSFPIAPYLMAVTASSFAQYTEFYHRTQTSERDSIPVEHYFWHEDDTNLELNNNNYNARATFRHTLPTLQAFAQWFGEYPFERYGHVAVQPFAFGGMEHQTLSTINRAWLRGTATGIAHEIAHQWFGNKVTCASWEHIWLNEGIATYAEALWYESWGGKSWHNVAFEGFRREYFQGNNAVPVFVAEPYAIERVFNYATTYCKGAYVHRMLRQMLGDTVYFRGMRAFHERFAFGTATTADLLQIFEELASNSSPVPLAIFFQQWIYSARHPVLSAVWSALPPETSMPGDTIHPVDITFYQVQYGDNVPAAFHCVLPIVFVRGADSANAEIILSQRRQTVRLNLPFQPDTLLIDPEKTILAEHVPFTDISSSRFSQGSKPEIRIAENPLRALSPLLNMFIALPRPETITVDVLDALGRTVQTLFAKAISEGVHNIHEQVFFPAAGTYYVRLRSSAGIAVTKVLVVP